jgi:hypothetical protein
MKMTMTEVMDCMPEVGNETRVYDMGGKGGKGRPTVYDYECARTITTPVSGWHCSYVIS